MAQNYDAFIKYGTKAREEHITYEDSFVPGFVTFNCDVDVHLKIWGKTLHAGNYFLLADDMRNANTQNAYVYMVTFDADQMLDEAERAGYDEITRDDGTIVRMIKNETSLNLTMEPIEIEQGHYLTFIEFIAWLAMTVAESDEIRDAIFNAAYTVEVKDGAAKQTSRKASRRYDPVTKLHQSLTDPEIYDAQLAIDVAGRGEKKKGKQVDTFVSLEYVGDDDSLTLTREISEFDIQVYNAVCSLWEAEKDEFTLQEIFEMTIGKGKAKQQQLDRLSESVERFRRTRMMADVTQEAKAHGLIDPETGEPWAEMKIDDYLLNALRIQMRGTNGKITTGYRLHSTPVLLRYAKASKQIVSYPRKYLDTKSAGSNTERNVVIRGYLLQRIAQAKHGKMSNTIRCETIYDKAGIDKQNRVERGRVDKYVTGLLDLWIKQGMIKGYEAVSEGRRRMSKIVVTFPDRAK